MENRMIGFNPAGSAQGRSWRNRPEVTSLRLTRPGSSKAFFRSRLSSSRLPFRSSAGSVVKGRRFAATGDLITAGL